MANRLNKPEAISHTTRPDGKTVRRDRGWGPVVRLQLHNFCYCSLGLGECNAEFVCTREDESANEKKILDLSFNSVIAGSILRAQRS
jgi:hypothetical protein